MLQETLALWPTVIELRHFGKPAAFNAALVAAVEPRELYPPVEKETGGRGVSWDRFDPSGWRGNIFAELAHVPEIIELERMFAEAARAYIASHLDRRYLDRTLLLRGWANRYERGQSIVGHHHGAVHLTATYYAQVGAPATGDPLEGRLILSDPRGGIMCTTAPHGQRYVITPEPGLMMVMPGYLSHETEPFHGAPARVAISVDIVLQMTDLRHYRALGSIEAAGGEAVYPRHLTDPR